MQPMPPPDILHQSPHFIVLNKPAGLAVHPGPSGGPSIEDWFPQLTRRKDGPWLVHRLDADTAGCLVIALRKTALVQAQELFASGAVRKTYWAVVAGYPKGDAGTVNAPLRRVSDRSGWRMAAGPGGQSAVSDWRVLGPAPGMTWLEVHPHTGRTHQVRVHCAELGTPILGDERYGTAGPPLHLLSRAIEIPLQPPVHATAPVPPHMLAALRKCGYQEA